ncbi:ribonuclease III [Pluteus cervinus]|uniref:Ribonuclease III n=1 Tax=Pluteus cervinus TaxID=181527 RepID=A0ACD3BE36_9AGAR|nr:ribonuclease III [Pluteus cervinus]
MKDQDSQAFVPAVRIMNDFYHSVTSASKPRILAIGASTAASSLMFDSGMLKLESLLDARVYGIGERQREELMALPDRPSEVVVVYEPLKGVTETKLFKQLHQLDPAGVVYKQLFKSSQRVLVDLGSCGSDLVWRRALKDIKSSVMPWYDDDDIDDDADSPTHSVQVRVRTIVANWDFTMPNLDSASRGFNVTHKFLRLVQVLRSFAPYGEAFRGIIFVHRRITALIMAELLRTLDEQLSFIRPVALTGQMISKNILLKQEIIRGFAIGTHNLLVVTKSAEDVDIPKALLVLRFDLFDSEISYAHLRARTRGRESHIVHMVQKGNDTHRRIVSQSAELDLPMSCWIERLCTSPHSSKPPRALRESAESYNSESEDEGDEYLMDPTTSGRIYVRDATPVLYRFISQTQPTTEALPLFDFDEYQETGTARMYICKVFLHNSHNHDLRGSPWPSMALARRAACYEACRSLIHQGLLDYRFYLSPKGGSLGAQPLKADSTSSGTRCYPRKPPDFWVNAPYIPLTGLREVYPTAVTTNRYDERNQPYGTLLILTWKPLPVLPKFKLFFSGLENDIVLHRGRPLQLDESQLTDLHGYTMRLCRAMSNKPFVCPLPQMPYLFAPVDIEFGAALQGEGHAHDFEPYIDWDSIRIAASNWAVPLKAETVADLIEDLNDAVVQDRWVEFTRRYEVVKLRTDLTPLSKPADSPREAEYDSLLHFCKERRKGFEGLKDENQPIIEVDKVAPLLNHLNPHTIPVTPTQKFAAKYLIPELCAKFTVPARFLRTALLLPSIMKRLDDYLLVKELNTKMLENTITDDLLHRAITAPSAGMEYDYERLELLGDAFLKYLSSVYVFVTNPLQSEGALHVSRQKIVSNKALFHSAMQAGLPPFIQAKPLAIKTWQPSAFRIVTPPKRPTNENLDTDPSGAAQKQEPKEVAKTNDVNPDTPEDTKDSPVETLTIPIPENPVAAAAEAKSTKSATKPPFKKKRDPNEARSQWLGDKAIADVAEAILGAAYIAGGRDAALEAVKALQIPIKHIDHWGDLGRKVVAPPAVVTAKLRPGSIEAVESIIGHQFKHPHLLAQALTHNSFQGTDSITYERLEFIGDAILDFLVIRHIFDREEQLSPGGMTLLKGAMVSNSALAAACIWAGLHEHMLFESQHLANNIKTYADQLASKQKWEYELARRDGRDPGQYWLEVEPPKALSDVVESVIGAVYISDNFSPVGAEALYDKVLKPFYDKHVSLKTLSHHPTKSLFELFQAQGCQGFEIQKEKQGSLTCCSVLVHDIILAAAEDVNPNVATRRSSIFALDALEGDPTFVARNCDCRSHPQAKKAKRKGVESVLTGFDEEDVAVLDEMRSPGPGTSTAD